LAWHPLGGIAVSSTAMTPTNTALEPWYMDPSDIRGLSFERVVDTFPVPFASALLVQ
jgi:hypothetical protein